MIRAILGYRLEVDYKIGMKNNCFEVDNEEGEGRKDSKRSIK
jgi:hypothetical protein